MRREKSLFLAGIRTPVRPERSPVTILAVCSPLHEIEWEKVVFHTYERVLMVTTYCKCKYILALQMYCIVSKYLPGYNQSHGPIITERLTVIQLVKKFLALYEK